MRLRPYNYRLVTPALLLIWLCSGATAPVVHSPAAQPATALAGAVYYVSLAGDDDNPGTNSLPWRTINKAAATLVAGETVYILSGTYNEQLAPQNSGAPGNEIVFSAYPGATVTLDGTGVVLPEWEGLVNIVLRSYLRVSGLRVVNSGPTPHNPGILVEQSNHIQVDHNYVYQSSDSGIAVWVSSDVVVEHNEVEDACMQGYNESISVGGSSNFEVRYNTVHHGQKEGIDPKDGSHDGKVYGNYVHHTGAVGIYVDAWDKHVYNIEVFGNVVHDAAGDGFSFGSEQGGLLENIRVYNNIAYHNKWVGINLHDCCIASHPVRNVQIVNNTVYNNGWDPWGGGIAVSNPQAEAIVVRNNICGQNLYFQIALAEGLPAANVLVDHNLIDGFRDTEGEIYGSEYVTGNPLFSNPAAADFHLLDGSPAIDQGSPVGAPVVDHNGQPRPAGAGFDIGAFEYGGVWLLVFLPIVQ